jgi:PAS domain S-box-containing protein
MRSLPALPPVEQLFDQAACGLIVCSTDGTILRANETFCRWMGRAAEELAGRHRLQDLLTMGGRVFHQTHWSPLLQIQGSVAEMKLEFVHRDGHKVPMLLNVVRRTHESTRPEDAQTLDEVSLMVVSERHKYERELLLERKKVEEVLAERTHAQRELQESRGVLSLAMRSARMGAWSRDVASGRVRPSVEMLELLGLSQEEYADAKYDDLLALVHPDDRPDVTERIAMAMQGGRDYAVDFRMRHAGGQWLWMQSRGRPVLGVDGTAVAFHGLCLDITETRRAQDELRRLNQRLSDADRRKDEFLATLAHELRNPLAPMRNVLAILERKGSDDAQVLWCRGVLERQLTHMTRLVDDLLEVSRITQGKVELRIERVDLRTIVEAAVESSRPWIDAASHRLELQVCAQPAWLEGDRVRLTQIIVNLLNNAAKYTPAGGIIRLECEREDDEAVVRVIDSGIGIAAEQLSTVFEMFSQLEPALERAHGGLGIGLALVRGLVLLHGGSISAHSDGPGTGSTFTVRLPLAAEVVES